MNFIRRRNQTQLGNLQEIYKMAFDQSINCMQIEQQEHKPAEALQGWKSLHTAILYQLEAVERSFQAYGSKFEKSVDEIGVIESVCELNNQAKFHIDRLTKQLEARKQHRLPPPPPPHRPRPPSNSSSSVSSLTSASVKSLRPSTMTSLRNGTSSSPQIPVRKPILRSLRPNGHQQRLNSIASTSASIAATQVWDSPSTSLSTNSGRRSTGSKSASPRLENKGSFQENKERKSQDLDERGSEYDLLNLFEDEIAVKSINLKSPLIPVGLESINVKPTPVRKPPPPLIPSSITPPQNKIPKHTRRNPSMTSISQKQQISSQRTSSQKSTSDRSIKPTQQKPAIIQSRKKNTAAPVISTQKKLKPKATVPKSKVPLSSVPRRDLAPRSKPLSQTTKSKPKLNNTKQTVSSRPPSKIIPKPKLLTSTSKNTITNTITNRESSGTMTSNGSGSESGSKDTESLTTIDAAESEESLEAKRLQDLVESIKGIDQEAAKQIMNEIVVKGDEVHWDDIAGLDTAKNSLKETVVYPFLRPDLFSGLREPARGMLLFGPPGTGKTMLARAVATESHSTFFSISASSLTSKFLGESEKLVRALFKIAKKLAPSIIFVDEIDSLLSSRGDNENEASRRIKTEFLVQWNDLSHAAASREHDDDEDAQRVLVLAATNLPWAVDEAARRRFVRRQYIPLPEAPTRKAHVEKLLSNQKKGLSSAEMEKLIELTDGFSGSDLTALAKDAAMGPLRELGEKLLFTAREDIRPINLHDFIASLTYIRPSVSKNGLIKFEEWASKYGSSGA